jgi:hypothetical protein
LTSRPFSDSGEPIKNRPPGITIISGHPRQSRNDRGACFAWAADVARATKSNAKLVRSVVMIAFPAVERERWAATDRK